MVEKNKANHDSSETTNSHRNSKPSYLRLVFICGGIAVAGLLIAAIWWPNLTERMKFFTTNLWVLVTAFAVIAQAVIYRKQWRVMERQGKVMRGQLETIEKQAGFMETQTQAALKAADMAMGQLIVMQRQEQAQVAALEETRKLVAQNERAVEAAESNIEAVERTSIYASRAYVAATIAQIEEGFQFHLYIENSGNTPANDVRIAYAFELREKPPVEKTEGQVVSEGDFSRTEGFGLIPPRSGRTFVTAKCPALTGEEWKRWKSNQIKFYCWGAILYFDIFSRKRVTWFCFYQSFLYPQGGAHEYGNHAI